MVLVLRSLEYSAAGGLIRAVPRRTRQGRKGANSGMSSTREASGVPMPWAGEWSLEVARLGRRETARGMAARPSDVPFGSANFAGCEYVEPLAQRPSESSLTTEYTSR
jgi:hypothetical protein